jgi:hypothetical protein
MTKPTHGGPCPRPNAAAPKQISIRLGNLAEPIQQAAALANLSTGEWIKRALAERLGIELEPYKPDPSSMAKMAAAKRWGKNINQVEE